MTYSTCSRLSCDGRSSSGQLHRTCSGSHLKNSATELIATTDSSKTKEYICSTNRGSNGGSLGFRSFQNSGLANAPILSECENKWCQHQYQKHRVLFEPVGECRLLLRLRQWPKARNHRGCLASNRYDAGATAGRVFAKAGHLESRRHLRGTTPAKPRC